MPRTLALTLATLAASAFAAPASAPILHTLKLRTEADTRAYFHYNGHPDVPIVSAHRGGSEIGYPENTIAAFEHTLAITPTMFETDPRVTSDGQLVVMHDATLDRTTQQHGKVNKLTLAQLQQVPMKDSAGSPVANMHPPSLDEAIEWAKGKTILNLDIKDASPQQRLDYVRKHDAFGTVLFTVHSAEDAKFFYQADHRSLMACIIFNLEQMKTYEDAGIPWSNIAIGYVGTKSLAENKPLYDALHAKGVMVMVSTAPTDDKLPTAEERAVAYRKVITDGADILESDRALEAAGVLKAMYPAKSERYRFWSGPAAQ